MFEVGAFYIGGAPQVQANRCKSVLCYIWGGGWVAKRRLNQPLWGGGGPGRTIGVGSRGVRGVVFLVEVDILLSRIIEMNPAI